MLFRKLGLLVLFKIKTRQQNKFDKFDCEVKVKSKAKMKAMLRRKQAFTNAGAAEAANFERRVVDTTAQVPGA